MSKKTFSECVLATLFILVSSASFAQTSGQLTIKGRVALQDSISILDYGVVLDPLGKGYYNEKVGLLTINSNNSGGFRLTLSSANAGYIAQGNANNERLSYTVNLANLQGNLGSNVSSGNLYGISPDGGVMNFQTYGNIAGPTVGASYDIQVNTPPNGNLKPGDQYVDTLTITLSVL